MAKGILPKVNRISSGASIKNAHYTVCVQTHIPLTDKICNCTFISHSQI